MEERSEAAAPPSAAPEATAPPSAATGAGSTDDPGSAAAGDAADLARSWERKNAASFRKGKKEGQTDLLRALGVETVEEVQQILDLHRAAEEERDSAAEQSEAQDYRATIRQIRSESKAITRELEEARTAVQQLREQNDRARRAELRARFLEAGAHPEAVADLVARNADRVEWSDDGDGLEVVERAADGSSLPAGMTLEEMISEQRERRSYAFAAPAARGSGTAVSASAAPRGAAVSPRRETWQDRIARAKRGPEA